MQVSGFRSSSRVSDGPELHALATRAVPASRQICVRPRIAGECSPRRRAPEAAVRSGQRTCGRVSRRAGAGSSGGFTSARGLRYGVRVRRLVLLALVAVAPGSARAEDRFTAHGQTYVDSDDTEGVRPSVSGAIGVTDELEVAGSYTVDVITTASIDVITNATAPAFSDRRDEAGLSATYRPLTGTEVGAGATWSDESDYRS